MQPLYIANSAQCNHCYVNVKHIAIRQSSTSKPSISITLKRHDRDVAAQINAILTLPDSSNGTCCLTKRTCEWSRTALSDCHLYTELTTDRGHLTAGKPTT